MADNFQFYGDIPSGSPNQGKPQDKTDPLADYRMPPVPSFTDRAAPKDSAGEKPTDRVAEVPKPAAPAADTNDDPISKYNSRYKPIIDRSRPSGGDENPGTDRPTPNPEPEKPVRPRPPGPHPRPDVPNPGPDYPQPGPRPRPRPPGPNPGPQPQPYYPRPRPCPPGPKP